MIGGLLHAHIDHAGNRSDFVGDMRGEFAVFCLVAPDDLQALLDRSIAAADQTHATHSGPRAGQVFRPGFPVPLCPPVNPGGAFYAFANVTGTGMNSRELAGYLLHEAGVACLNGGSFGDYGDGFIRFSYANSLANLMEAVERIQKVSARWESASLAGR